MRWEELVPTIVGPDVCIPLEGTRCALHGFLKIPTGRPGGFQLHVAPPECEGRYTQVVPVSGVPGLFNVRIYEAPPVEGTEPAYSCDIRVPVDFGVEATKEPGAGRRGLVELVRGLLGK